MKSLVKKCAGYLGYEIRKIHPSNAGARAQVLSAVDHNSRSMREDFYTDARLVASYLSDERRRFYGDVTDLIKRRLPTLRTAMLRFADYGCGPGLLLRQLSETSPNSVFHGYDFTKSGIRVARENFPAASFEERDIYDVFPDRYDVILCTEVLEHLERPHQALKNLLDQLAPGGHLLLTVPDGRADQYAGHIHFWSPESWKLFVEDTCPGLDVETGSIATRGSPPFLYALIAGHAGPADRPHMEVAYAKR